MMYANTIKKSTTVDFSTS